jgi:hypothetical protein
VRAAQCSTAAPCALARSLAASRRRSGSFLKLAGLPGAKHQRPEERARLSDHELLALDPKSVALQIVRRAQNARLARVRIGAARVTVGGVAAQAVFQMEIFSRIPVRELVGGRWMQHV